MANITIPNLPQAVSIDGTEQLLGVQSGTSKSITTGQIVSLAVGGGGVTPLAVSVGGTGNTTFDTYGVLYGDGTNPVESIAPPAGADYILVASPGTVPAWQENIPVTAGVNSISFGSTGLTPNTATEGIVTVAGTLVAASGGTGQSSYAVGDLLYSDTTTTLAKLADVATGSVLISGGVGVAPSYSASPTLTTSLTTPLLIGGTAASSSLTLQSTSGVGTTDSILFKVGSNGATTAMTINTSGNVGIGTSAITTTALRVTQGITGGTIAQSIRSDGAIQTDVTSAAYYFISSANMASGTIGNLNHYAANQGTIGATVTNQSGFYALGTLIGATNNYSFIAANTAAVTAGKTSYGFYSDIDIATGGGTTYGFYANGTATNYFGGNVGIGTTSLTSMTLRVTKAITGSTTAVGIRSDGAIQTDVTSNGYYFSTSANMASGTIGSIFHYGASQGTIGATVTAQAGFLSEAGLIGATSNYGFLANNTAAVTTGKAAYGFYSGINTATGGGTTYQFYAAGTAPSVINGTVTLGTPLAVSSGGTGATTANAALTNLTTFTTTATAAGTTVLTNTSTYFQYFTGATTQTITLPVTSTLATGWSFHIVNNSTGNLTVNSSGANLVITVLPGTTVMCTCIGTALTTAADWEAGYTDFSTATGTGSVVLATSPTLVTPVLGVASATSLSATTLTATAGAGFQNMVVQITGTSASYSLPAAVQVTGAKLKVTIVGGGGQGGGTTTTAGLVGGGGGGGGAIVVFLTYVAGQNTLTYTVGPGGSGAGTNAAGTAGTASSIIYNGVTYTAGGGGGGPTATTTGSGTGGTATGGTLNIVGQIGGAGGTSAATANMMGNGGNAGLGLGYGAPMPSATGTGNAAASGYGGGGSGGFNGATATARAGGAGAAGVVIIEY